MYPKGGLVESSPHTTFVVRIWWSETARKTLATGTQRRWYGHVEHIESGQQRSFRDLNTLLAFIREKGGLDAPWLKES